LLRVVKGTATTKQGPTRRFLSEIVLNGALLLVAVLATVMIIGAVGMLHETQRTVKKEAASDIHVMLPENKPLQPLPQEEDPVMEEPEKIYEAKNRQAPDMEKTQPKFKIDALGLGIDANLTGLAIAMSTWDISPPKGEYGMSEVDQVPAVTLQIPPEYPYHARRQGTEGVVSIRFLVTREGEVSSFSVLKASPEGVFDEATRRSVLRWKFRPGVKDGRDVDTWVEMDIEFELE
jgi:protein TonB